MSQYQRAPPRFKVGDFVHLTTPLDPRAASTWLSEGEISLDSSTTCNPAGDERTPVTIKREHDVKMQSAGTSSNLSDFSNTSASSAPQRPLSVLITEKKVALHDKLPYITNKMRHATPWKVDEVIPTENEDEEHTYGLVPADHVTAFVAESVMVEAPVFVGTIVRKEGQQRGFWLVVGISVKDNVVWVDVMNSDGDVEIVDAKELKMLPVSGALEALVE